MAEADSWRKLAYVRALQPEALGLMPWAQTPFRIMLTLYRPCRLRMVPLPSTPDSLLTTCGPMLSKLNFKKGGAQSYPVVTEHAAGGLVAV
eukprot:291822-Pyramimonas_sp.AAC.1